MVRHFSQQLDRNDPEVTEVVKQLYEGLSDEAMGMLDRVARLRIGIVALILFLSIDVMATGHRGFDALITLVTGVFFILASIMALIGVVLVIRRAMDVSDVIVKTYTLMAPDQADEILAVYGERGLGDLFAPWIRRRRGRIGQAREALFKGLMPWDRRRR